MTWIPMPWGVSLDAWEPLSEDPGASLGPLAIVLLVLLGFVEGLLECGPEGPHRLVDAVRVEPVLVRAQVQDSARQAAPRL